MVDSITSKILYNKEVAPGYFRIGLEWKGVLVQPGQFVMLRVFDSLDPLLRRPFGIYKVIKPKRVKSTGGYRGTGIELLYCVVGRGTERLSRLVPGETVGLLGPLGNGFPCADKNRRVIMVAGGVGTVPFYLIADTLGEESTLLVGARSKEASVLASDFSALKCKVGIATEDGSVGSKGLVTALLKKELARDSASMVYGCGPLGMLKAVAEVSKAAGVESFVSLERSMACGIGVCLGCAVKASGQSSKPFTSPGYVMVCSNGPVFKSSEVDWEKL